MLKLLFVNGSSKQSMIMFQMIMIKMNPSKIGTSVTPLQKAELELETLKRKNKFKFNN